jgi:arylformamidase
MKKWVDVSLPLKNGLVHWPGDPPFTVERVRDLDRGDDATVSHLNMGAHSGTHMDAPAHFIRGGASLDSLPPDAVIGRGRVIGIDDEHAVTPDELEPCGIRRGSSLHAEFAAWVSITSPSGGTYSTAGKPTSCCSEPGCGS